MDSEFNMRVHQTQMENPRVSYFYYYFFLIFEMTHSCKIMGSSGLIVQSILGLLSFLVLMSIDKF